jgi:hypothetical protein
MSAWLVLLILGLMAVVSVIIVIVTRRDESIREKQRERFELRDTGERVPLVDSTAPPPPAPKPIGEIATFISSDAPETTTVGETREDKALTAITEGENLEPPSGRFVKTPDGESLLTSPPFRRRESIFSKRHGRYALWLTRRLPPWLVVCPKVRLDTLVLPTSPDGRDPDDWREWRRRVRMRAIDLVLIDRRTWEPLLAIMLERDHPTPATTIAGGKDRIIDEVLAAVDLPLIRGTGSFKDDWPAIRPYVEQAMLPTTEDADREPVMGGATWDASAVVKLLSFDDERGGLLE